jgi:putative ABC transport system permease protein
MRPEAPARFRHGLAERVAPLRRLPLAARVVVRNLERRPAKALLSVLGLALAIGIVVTTRALFDAIDYMKELQFHHVAREDVRVAFEAPRAPSAARELARLPGVRAVEPFRRVPARLRVLNRSRPVAILGLPRDGRLHRVVDAHRRVLPPPEHGLLLSAALAEILGVRRGDTVTVEVLEGARPRRGAVVAGIVDELFGTAAYMDARALGRLVGDGRAVSGAFLRVDSRAAGALYARLKRLPAVHAVGVRESELAGFESTIAESFSGALYLAMAFACVIAFGMAYNGARIALSERGRELASLRVLGFSQREVTAMLLGEQAVLTMLAIPAGFAIAWLLSWLVAVRFDSELFRIPVVVAPGSYLFGAVVVVVAAALSALAVRRRVARLDLIEVLKTRE